jgi:hypothetical protein
MVMLVKRMIRNLLLNKISTLKPVGVVAVVAVVVRP